uniref:DNA-directed RNA polymerase II subunit RPB7 n=1 Tax=Strombidium rassoulzadegani TaxID=1082188 RepID=A0A7S3CKY1_9SPIT|mmetsp:Transcript_14775/g.25137  ORF Transcript_14775/g.25137 Transcript_14775/m.25137 type:complete len:182 (+) Transcript_14775:29-574(+)
MFLIVKNVYRIISIEPQDLGIDLKRKIKRKINQLLIGQCSEEFGYIIDINRYYFDMGEQGDDLEGVVQDTTGDVVFNARFDIIALKPNKNEVLDGKVMSITDNGIEVFSGPIKSFIDKNRLGAEYEYNSTNDQYLSLNPDLPPIKRGTKIRYRIENLKFQNNEFAAISTIQDNYLGVINSH